MADNIRVESSELLACANEYRQSLETLEDAVMTYQNALNALANDWTGRAFMIMSGKVADMVSKIVASFDRVGDAITELNDTNEMFEGNESDLKGTFGGLDVGTKSPFGS